ncbi:MAG TPA: VOC family protein [Stellaceae bacterium]|nr:VOC family protein [Stellaceae bacterium]
MTLDRRTLLKHAAAIGAFSLSTSALAESPTDMTHVFSAGETDRQLPTGDEIFLDHVGHFVRDPGAASKALERAGFAPTPVSVQVNPDPSGGAPRPTGTGNVTAMLRRGYLEMLFRTADTPLGRELDEAVAHYAGVHLAAFSVADAAKAHARLGEAGFKTRPLVQLERPVATQSGAGKAAFTVARVAPEAMAEGRIQILTHHTEDTVWQKRWLAHPNGALALVDVVIAVADVDEAARRYARFTDRPAVANAWGYAIVLERGRVQIASIDATEAIVSGLPRSGLPFMCGYGVAVASLDAAQAKLRAGGIETARRGKLVVAPFPPELGEGAWCFVETAAHLPWRA